MKTSLIAAAVAGLAMIGTASDASAWTRDSTITTPRGTYERSVTGSCAYGGCSRSTITVGPHGGTTFHSGRIVRLGPGVGTYYGTTVGPRGGVITRQGTVTWTPGYPYRPY
jgi:hypothetical protein